MERFTSDRCFIAFSFLSVRLCVSFTSLEVQQKPAVAEVEVSVVSVLLHQFKQLRVQDLFIEKQYKCYFYFTTFCCICMQAHTSRCTYMYIPG